VYEISKLIAYTLFQKYVEIQTARTYLNKCFIFMCYLNKDEMLILRFYHEGNE